jgi:nicotinamidase-related amidase
VGGFRSAHISSESRLGATPHPTSPARGEGQVRTMPVQRPMNSILLALHYQNEVLHKSGRIRLGVAEHDPARDAVIAAARRLLDGARAHRIPVVSVRIAFRPDHEDVIANAEIWRRVVAGKVMVEGSWGAEFHDGLGPLPGEFVVTHGRNNAFYASPLEAIVRRLAPARLILAGIATNFVVESTARHASDLGYDTVIAGDACSAGSPEAHRASLATLAMLATVSTVDEIVAQWGRGE